MINRILRKIVLVAALLHSLSMSATIVSELTVNTLPAPAGIDSAPAFGWKIIGDGAGDNQAGYEIKVYSDETRSNMIYSSGFVESGATQNIVLSDLILTPVTRYYWAVESKTNSGEVINSATAHFDTGLMGDWSGARWLRSGGSAFNDGTLKYTDIDQTIDATINVVSGNPGITFSTESERCCFNWQFMLEEDNVTLSHLISNWGDFVNHGQTVLQGFTKNDFIGKDVKIRIEVEAKPRRITTFVNDEKVDEFVSANKIIYPNGIGFCDRSNVASHEIYINNIKHTYTFSDGVTEEYMVEDFEDGYCHNILDLDVIKIGDIYKGHIKSSAEGYFVAEIDMHQPVFYNDFKIDKEIESAWLFTSSLGCYDAYINGERVGTKLSDGSIIYEELKPSSTDFRHIASYFSHDVTYLLKNDKNIIGIELNKGYTRGDIGHGVYKTFPCIIAKLHIKYTDGTEQTIVTDSSWKMSATGPLMDGDIYRGEYFDARYLYPWDKEYNNKPLAVRLYSELNVSIVPFFGQPLRTITPLSAKNIVVYDGVETGNDYGQIKISRQWTTPQSVILRKGETAIYDFGQNCSFVPRFKVKGKRGSRIKMRFAERINDSGLKSRNNDGPQGSIYRKNYRFDNVAVLYYTLSGNEEGEVHTPTSTFFGARYCEVRATDDVEIISLESLPLTSSYEQIGQVATDNDLVNKIFSNTLWSQYSNIINIPIDCPSRNERMGWTGDINTFALTAMYNADIIELLRKWLRDLRLGQLEDGAYPDIAPYTIDNKSYGNVAWADAGIMIPWNLYMMSGKIDIIKENYPSMKRYMDYVASFVQGNIQYPGTKNTYADWWGFGTIDKLFMSEVYYAHYAELMTKMATALTESPGDAYDNDANCYAMLYSAIKEEIQSLYFDSMGLTSPTQAACSLAIVFNICADDNQRKAVGKQLADLIASNGYKLDTGFVCTAFILKALSETGNDDVAYRLLLQRDCPSWLYMIDQGATTFWEHWDGYTSESGFAKFRENSFNHFAFGAVVEWMYTYMAGIMYDESAPGFKRIIFKPHPDVRVAAYDNSDNIHHVRASHVGPYGEISAQWNMDGSDFTYNVSVPNNSEALVLLPVSENVSVNGAKVEDIEDVEYVGKIDGRQAFNIKPGNYFFATQDALDLKDEVIPHIAVFPNPVSDVLHLRTNSEINSVTLYDLSSRLIMVWEGNKSDLDVSFLQSAGIYLLKISTPKGDIVKKIVKI